MKIKYLPLYFSIALLLTSCTFSAPKRSTDEASNSCLAITLDLKGTAFDGDIYKKNKIIFYGGIDGIYFARIDGPDYKKKKLFHTNFRVNNTFYAFNIRPGKYAAVYALVSRRKESGKDATIYKYYFFPKEMARKATVRVNKNSTGFMGEFTARPEPLKNPDDVQEYYLREVAPELRWSRVKKIFNDLLEDDEKYFYQVVHKDTIDDPKTRARFLKFTIKRLKNTGWQELFERELGKTGYKDKSVEMSR